ncbi:alpha/beta hydrolase [Atopomonas sediminilitoris]|uniref:alpha/beta hydrolase n=1 Tax=Atopomonas sediminilitoris TaxID=2919919 RepID=UPI001F4E7E64|nr:dienelactone hydrolase family protein [Atopomonas sediminilitoris]MCJ8169655.1 dienelactone hydrolase family protein [Atopomonas sediminilitoris]
MQPFITPPLLIEPSTSANACLIWLHGLGADRFDFEPLLRNLVLPKHIALRCVLPQAPNRPVTMNGGWVMPAWYDILALMPARQVNPTHLAECSDYLEALIGEQEQAGIARERILLAGFSQGGAVVLHTALRTLKRPVTGVIGLSTYLPDVPDAVCQAHLCQTPVLYFHGQQDDVVPHALGQQACQTMAAAGVNVQAYQHNGAHEVPTPCIAPLQDWLSQRLS